MAARPLRFGMSHAVPEGGGTYHREVLECDLCTITYRVGSGYRIDWKPPPPPQAAEGAEAPKQRPAEEHAFEAGSVSGGRHEVANFRHYLNYLSRWRANHNGPAAPASPLLDRPLVRLMDCDGFVRLTGLM